MTLHDRGSATVWMIGVTTSAFLMIGLVLDGGTMLRARSEAFSVAGAAARAGAQELDPRSAVEGVPKLDRAAAEAAALGYLSDRGFGGTAVASDEVVTVTVVSEVTLQIVDSLGGEDATFNATASARAVKVAP